MQNRPTLAQRQFARHLRTSQTDCEQLLWQKLRSRQVAGLKFRRQVPVPPFVLDFYCVELTLAVELDGGCIGADCADSGESEIAPIAKRLARVASRNKSHGQGARKLSLN